MPERVSSRYIELTDAGLDRLVAARRALHATIEEVCSHPGTPSINTVKRLFRREPVFLSTLERLCDYFEIQSAEAGVAPLKLREGRDYRFVDSGSPIAVTGPLVDSNAPGAVNGAIGGPRLASNARRPGWISRSVPSANRLFTGREAVLKRLHAALDRGPAALVGDAQALTGMGGIGKTQTAIAYIYRHRNEYSHVFWIDAETPEQMNDGLANLAAELGLSASAPSAKRQALDAMYDWFRSESGWLLVLDNVDNLETLARLFPKHHGGSLILSTRARDTVKWAAPISLSPLDREQGALLLLRRSGALGIHEPLSAVGPALASAAGDLSDEVGGLPLALAQAGAYLAQAGCTVAEYRARYREIGLSLLDRTADTEHAPVAITLTLALRQLAESAAFGSAAADLVRLSAYLAPDAIPESVFRAYLSNQTQTAGDGHHRAAPASDRTANAESAGDRTESYAEIRAAACEQSILARSPDNETLSIHRLFQRAILESMGPEERRNWARRAVKAVAQATPDFEYEDWRHCDQLLPQWRECARHIRDFGIQSEQAAYLLYQAGRYVRARALFDEAKGYTERALEIAESVYGPRHLFVADCLDELACLHRMMDRPLEAESLHCRAIAVIEALEGPEYLLLASKLHNLALLYLQTQDHEAAETLLKRAVAIHEMQSSPDEHLVATALTQLAGVYRIRGSYDRAEACCRRALETYERLLEPGHVDIATGCNNLALLYLSLKRLPEAADLYLRGIGISEAARGADHPESANMIWGLARVRWEQGDFEEAGTQFERASYIYNRHYSPDHSLMVRFQSSYDAFIKEREAEI